MTAESGLDGRAQTLDRPGCQSQVVGGIQYPQQSRLINQFTCQGCYFHAIGMGGVERQDVGSTQAIRHGFSRRPIT